jgi:hypothetical protein
LVLDPEGFTPTRPWDGFDGRRPPDTRLDKRPAWGEIDDLSRADAQHGVHAGLDEEGEMSVRTQAPIGHEDIP